uniref:Uncharacterized protein MANES_12G036600 n=1 Tax=Rhizophora mucronata TaxID=61149 RepID=A0A2P2MHQ6_RHIMU
MLLVSNSIISELKYIIKNKITLVLRSQEKGLYKIPPAPYVLDFNRSRHHHQNTPIPRIKRIYGLDLNSSKI